MKITTRNVQFRDSNGRMVSSAIIANGSLHDEVIDYLDNNPQALGDAVADATESWLAENITEPTQPAVDASLSVTGAAADAKKVGDELSELKSQISDIEEQIEGGTGSGLTDAIKIAIENCMTAIINLAEAVWYVDDDGRTYANALVSAKTALHEAFYPPATLESIRAVYTQSGDVYNTDSLDDLKNDLVVTAHYSDSSSEEVTNYTLSGTLTTGTSVITVSYSGKTTTFNVTVTYAPPYPLINGQKTVNYIQTGVTNGYHVRLTNTTQRVTASKYVNLRDVVQYSNNRNCPSWFNIPAGATAILTIKNVTNSTFTNSGCAVRLYKAGTETIALSCTFGAKTATLTPEEDLAIGSLIYFNDVAVPQNSESEFDVELTVNGELYFGNTGGN